MTPARKPTNLAASVRARLLELSRKRGVEFQLVLAEFAIERLLYRLGNSRYRDEFVLKGAMLFKVWIDQRGRATWDLDLLGRGSNTIADVAAAIREVCDVLASDGIEFNPESIVAEEIRAADEYAGVRIRLEAGLDGARIPMQVDVGFGDAIVPAPALTAYPALLDHEAPIVLSYRRETVVAEKFEAMVSLGVTNSRMKDFYDVSLLATLFAFDGATLASAVRATFDRRGVPLPESEPVALSAQFLAAPERQTQWRAFLRRGRLDAPVDTGELAEGLRRFLGPVIESFGRNEEFNGSWPAGGPWETDARILR